MQHVLLVVVPRWEGSGEGAAVWVAPVEKPLVVSAGLCGGAGVTGAPAPRRRFACLQGRS